MYTFRFLYVLFVVFVCCVGSSLSTPVHSQTRRTQHPWLGLQKVSNHSLLVHAIPTPKGYKRIRYRKNTFAHWLRFLPTLPKGSPVVLYNGRKKPNQQHHHTVIRMDVGKHDLQQCADAVMRLWGEYLWSRRLERIFHFRMLSGLSNPWTRWARGERRIFRRGRMSGWKKKRKPNASYSSFRRYLRYVMAWTNTSAMVRQLQPISRTQAQAGDMLLVGWKQGRPGHAILLLDEARNQDGKQLFLLGQSYMPAQSFHVLKAPGQKTSPWYSLPQKGTIHTPEWDFTARQFYRLQHSRGTR